MSQTYFLIDAARMRCEKPEHEQQRMKYICIDTTCTQGARVGCADCFLELHANHKRDAVEQIVERLGRKVTQIDKVCEEFALEASHQEFIEALNAEISHDITSLKQKVALKLDSLAQEFQNHASNRLKLLTTPDKNTDEFAQIKQLAVLRFEDLQEKELSACIHFLHEEKIARGLQEQREKLRKHRSSVQKMKQKYLERIMLLCAELLQSNEGSDDSEETTKKNLGARSKKRVHFADQPDINDRLNCEESTDSAMVEYKSRPEKKPKFLENPEAELTV